MAEFHKGGMAEWYFTTYLIYPAIFMVHTNNADDADDNDDAANAADAANANNTDGF
jgi:hypothetical protein